MKMKKMMLLSDVIIYYWLLSFILTALLSFISESELNITEYTFFLIFSPLLFFGAIVILLIKGISFEIKNIKSYFKDII